MPSSLLNMVSSGPTNQDVYGQKKGFKTAVHKPMGDVTDTTSIINAVYGFTPSWSWSPILFRWLGWPECQGQSNSVTCEGVSSHTISHTQSSSFGSLLSRARPTITSSASCVASKTALHCVLCNLTLFILEYHLFYGWDLPKKSQYKKCRTDCCEEMLFINICKMSYLHSLKMCVLHDL